MKPVRRIVGKAVPLGYADVDTDQIIPSEWCKRVERTGYEDGLFAQWREEADFVLNQPRYAGAEILLAGHNFGCGSSREHAVWALLDYGFRAVIAPSFGDIFRNNSLKMGLVPAELPVETVDKLLASMESDPSAQIAIDIEALTVEAPDAGVAVDFPLDGFTRWRLVNGLDELEMTLRHEDSIAAYEKRRPSWMPSTRVLRNQGTPSRAYR
jgi:3-isopropylmalate/(R)-2-methylmalate dehydratase small subunit